MVSEYFKHESPAELAFSFSYCSAGNKLGGNPAAINWQGEVAVIDVAISSNCGTTWIFAGYKLEEPGKLVLGYKSIVPWVIGCNCSYPATYRITGLEKRDYKIELREYAFINEVPWLVRSMMDVMPDIVEVEEF